MKLEKLLAKVELEMKAHYTTKTVQSYMYAVRRLVSAHPNAVNLELKDIESYFSEVKSKTESVGYRTVTLSAIKAFYNALLELDVIQEHPCRSLNGAGKSPKGKNFSDLLSMEEMMLLLNMKVERYNYVENRNKAMIGMLIFQGVTSKELVHLRTSDFDLVDGIVNIVGQGKNTSRKIKLHSSQIYPLTKYLEQDRPMLLKSTKTNRMFMGMRGVPITSDGLHAFINRFEGAFDKDITPTNIRNSVISFWLNERKIPLKDVQAMAGHRYPSSTERYWKPEDEEQREGVNRLHNKLFAR